MKRKKNPSGLGVLVGLAVVGGAGYLIYRAMEGETKSKSSNGSSSGSGGKNKSCADWDAKASLDAFVQEVAASIEAEAGEAGIDDKLMPRSAGRERTGWNPDACGGEGGYTYSGNVYKIGDDNDGYMAAIVWQQKNGSGRAYMLSAQQKHLSGLDDGALIVAMEEWLQSVITERKLDA